MLWPSSIDAMNKASTHDGACKQTQKTGPLNHAFAGNIERNETMGHKKPGTATSSPTLQPNQHATPLNSEQSFKHRQSFTRFLKNKEIIR